MKKQKKRKIKEEVQGTRQKCGGQRGMGEASGMKNRKLKKKTWKRGENDQVGKLTGLVQLLVLAVMLMLLLMMIVKGKAISLQGWTGPQGSRRLTIPDMKVVRLSALCTGHLYPLGNIPVRS